MGNEVTTTAIDRGLDADLAADLAATSFTLAKRFAAGATMWSIAPGWEPHALHIAVEFIHPVIVGKRALPAVAITGPNVVDVVRVSVRPGDIVVAVSGADDPEVRSVMQPKPGMGRHDRLDRQWRAAQARHGRPRAVAGRPRPQSAGDRRVRVVLPPAVGADPRLFRAPGPAERKSECTDDVCVTCSDEGRLGEVLAAMADGMATVRTANGVETVATTLVDPVAAGELVLVHAGTAIGRVVDEDAGAAGIEERRTSGGGV